MVDKRKRKRTKGGRGRDRVKKNAELKPFSLRAPGFLLERIAKIAEAQAESVNAICIEFLTSGLAAYILLNKYWEELRPAWHQDDDFKEPDLPTAVHRVIEFALREIRKNSAALPPRQDD